MKTLQLQYDTFVRTFGMLPEGQHDQMMRGIKEGLDPIRYVQPADGILKDYDKVEVTRKEMVGFGDWGRVPIDIVSVFSVSEYDDLSVIMAMEKVFIPEVNHPVKQPVV